MRRFAIVFAVLAAVLAIAACGARPAPEITGFSPARVLYDTPHRILVEGQNFQSGAVVTIGGGYATLATTWINSGLVSGVLPKGASPGVFSIEVTNPNGDQAISRQHLSICATVACYDQNPAETPTPAPAPTLTPVSSAVATPAATRTEVATAQPSQSPVPTVAATATPASRAATSTPAIRRTATAPATEPARSGRTPAPVPTVRSTLPPTESVLHPPTTPPHNP